MKLDKKKFNRQKEVIDKWFNNDCKGTLQAVTRFGKTFVGIIGAKRLVRDNPDLKIVVCVPTDYLRNKWKAELKKFELSGIVDTVHNLVKKDMDVDYLILDELHMFVGEDAKVFPTVFEKIRSPRILGLTATLGEDGIDRTLVNEKCPVIDTVTLEEALREGYISPYVQYNYGINLSALDQSKYNNINNRFYRYAATFHSDFDKAKACLDPEVASRYAQQINWDEGAVLNHARGYFREMRKRKEFLYGVDSKINVAKEIIEHFKDRKIITFSQTTEPADKLASLVDDAKSYHSNLTTTLFDKNTMKEIGFKSDKDKYFIPSKEGFFTWNQTKRMFPNVIKYGQKRLDEYILNSFINGETRVLCTAMKLDVGLDFDDIDMSITLSGSSKFRQNVQRIGRALNKTDGKLAIIIQLYIRGTQDEKWLDKRQTDMDDAIDISHISQIQV